MDVWNFINYLQCEQNAMKERHEKLVNFVGEILEAIKQEELKRLENIRKSTQTRCRYFNKGFCREENRCKFLHPSEVCHEFEHSGRCYQGSRCTLRHPRKCRYWVRGDCWRLDACVYLHKVEDFNKENEQADAETIDVADIELDTSSMEYEENTELDYSDEENLLEDFGSGPTTDEILQMYENVEINNKEGENQITTEEILKLYETTETVEEQIPLKKSSKRQSGRRVYRLKQTN